MLRPGVRGSADLGVRLQVVWAKEVPVVKADGQVLTRWVTCMGVAKPACIHAGCRANVCQAPQRVLVVSEV